MPAPMPNTPIVPSSDPVPRIVARDACEDRLVVPARQRLPECEQQ